MNLTALAQPNIQSDVAVNFVTTLKIIMATLKPFMVVFFIAFFVALIATPLMRMLAIKNVIVDWPDLHRKNHIEPIAYLGGIGIFFGWFAGVAFCYITQTAENTHLDLGMLISIILGALAITLTGLFDDVYETYPWHLTEQREWLLSQPRTKSPHAH